jgi:Flp pilus assembly protein TadB
MRIRQAASMTELQKKNWRGLQRSTRRYVALFCNVFMVIWTMKNNFFHTTNSIIVAR